MNETVITHYAVYYEKLVNNRVLRSGPGAHPDQRSSVPHTKSKAPMTASRREQDEYLEKIRHGCCCSDTPHWYGQLIPIDEY